MRIRPMKAEDYDALIELWNAAGLPYKPRGRESREAIEAQIAATPDLLLGAWEGERLVGAVIGSTDGRKGWINRLAVHPDRRRRGYGKALVAATEAALRERGLRIIAVLVEEDNGESLEFFEALGYEVLPIRYLTKRDGPHV
jgi:ribosomal protein S18 acetylase RimI-like enzyme